MLRRRSKPHSFEDQLAAEKARLVAQLARTPHGPGRDALVQKVNGYRQVKSIGSCACGNEKGRSRGPRRNPYPYLSSTAFRYKMQGWTR
jgi:hypothetical protein